VPCFGLLYLPVFCSVLSSAHEISTVISVVFLCYFLFLFLCFFRGRKKKKPPCKLDAGRDFLNNFVTYIHAPGFFVRLCFRGTKYTFRLKDLVALSDTAKSKHHRPYLKVVVFLLFSNYNEIILKLYCNILIL
jgi:hypothetical protein